MENNNIRTMEYVGLDDWSRPVYKCIETNVLWKDIECGNGEPVLCSCFNSFDGEPDCNIKNGLEIHFLNKYKEPTYIFNYQLLSRLKQDCEYYLGYGNRNASQLWGKDEKEQIEKMKELYNAFPKDQKPEWLTIENIAEYESKMVTKQNVD